jgi:hypothetical protein
MQPGGAGQSEPMGPKPANPSPATQAGALGNQATQPAPSDQSQAAVPKPFGQNQSPDGKPLSQNGAGHHGRRAEAAQPSSGKAPPSAMATQEQENKHK